MKPQNQRIWILVCQNCSLIQSVIDVYYLYIFEFVVALDLSGNLIRDKGINAIVRALGVTSSIQSLKLCNCGATAKGMSEMFGKHKSPCIVVSLTLVLYKSVN